MKELTSQQKKVLQCIEFYIKKTGFPPTRANICNELGFKSPNAAESHLRALEKKGFIEITSGASRGINLVKKQNSENKIPVIGLIAAGYGTESIEEVERFIDCKNTFFESKFDYFLKVQGLSMKDAGILEDDLVAIKRTQDIKNGDIVVAKIDDEVTLKYFSSKDGDIKLIPANEDFDEIIIDQNRNDFSIIGKSVGLIREN